MIKVVRNIFVSAIAVLCLTLAVSCNFEISAPPASDPEQQNTITEQTGSISGRVLFSNSSDHTGILVSLEQTDGLRSLSADSRSLAGSTSTGSDGSYSFKDIKPGVYTVYATHNSSLEKAAVARNIVVEAGRTLTLEDLHLTATANIIGRVTIDDNETGNLGIIVFIAGTSYIAITDDAGNFIISGVPIGQSYLIAVMKDSYTAVLSASASVISTAGMTLSDYSISSSSLEEHDSLVWKGSSSSAPESPATNWAYFNTTDGCSYIYNGSTWELLARAGQDAVSITWLGSLDTPPENPGRLNAYFNTQTGCSYIFDGFNWTLLAQAGKNGATGATGATGLAGADGKSIRWLGSFENAPENPSVLDAYFNSLDGSSYIYTGTEWSLLARGMAHEHTYVAPWTSNEAYHWHEASCGHTYYKGSVAEHEWDRGTVVSPATCTSTGIMKYMCTICYYEKQEAIGKTTHQYSVTSTTEPTCTVDGQTVHTCSKCGDTVSTSVLALGHDFGTDNVCDRCGYEKPDDHVHEYRIEEVPSTCTQMGYSTYSCITCSNSYRDNFVEPLGHSWDEGTMKTEATCTTDGIITYTCTRPGCNESRQEIIPAGHEYEYTVIIPATCTTNGVRTTRCMKCDYTLSEDPIPAFHTWDEGTLKTEVTCTTDGSILYRCTLCGAEKLAAIKETGHTYTNGICEVCGHSFIDDLVLDIDYPQYGMYFRVKDIKSAYGDKLINTYGVYLDHNSDAQIDKVGVYLTQDGTMWRRSLAFKGSNITKAFYVPFLSYASEIYYTGLNTSSINTFSLTKNSDGIYTFGNYTTIGVNLADSTGKLLLTLSHIGQAGAKTRIFSNLDEMITWLNEGEHVHAFGEWTIKTEPTCTEHGTKQRTCSSCGEVQTEWIVPKSHAGDWTVTVEPTCTGYGTRQRTCKICNMVETEQIEPTGHSFSSVWSYDDTCHWHASTCGHDEVVAGKAKHTFGKWTTVRVATAEQSGLMTRTCEDCGYNEEKDLIPYVNYNWDSVNNLLTSEVLTVSDYTVVTENTTILSTGWYVVSYDIEINTRITVDGTVNVILCDGITLRVEDGIRLNEENTLNIYGQENGTGSLISYSSSTLQDAGIGGNNNELCGNLNLYGGTLIASGRNEGKGIGDGAGIGGGGGAGGLGGTITIYGGTVTATGYGGGAGIGGGYNGDGGTITIYGGTVTATGDDGAGIGGGYNGDGGTITINGGTVTATGDSGAGIGGGDGGLGGTITIYGGTVTATSYGEGAGIGGGYIGDGGTITIYGGTVTATGDSDNFVGAGIGGGYNGDGGTITINGGTVTATGGNGAGIGGGYEGSGGTITIYGGTVTATGGNGACIGGGCNGDGGIITINEGTVTATGSDGAGIGGGYNGDGGTITINGGTVTATDDGGAGIGGGCNGDGGTITINEGTVTATGGGAGIGGGYNGDGGTITINEGTVTATGGSGAGIGGGAGGLGGTITIYGGTVTTTSIRGYGIGVGINGSGGTLYIDTNMVCSHDDEAYFTGPGYVTEWYKNMKVSPASSTT